jgi:hypothetical protein
MADWAVSPTEQTDWQIEPDEFEHGLKERFAGAETEPVGRYDQLIEFTVPLDDGTVTNGYLTMDQKGIWVDGPVEGAAQLAVWLRERTPAGQELALYDQSLGVLIPLKPGMTAAEIVAAASSA